MNKVPQMSTCFQTNTDSTPNWEHIIKYNGISADCLL